MAELGYPRQGDAKPKRGRQPIFWTISRKLHGNKKYRPKKGTRYQIRQWFAFFIFESLPEALKKKLTFFLWRISISVARYNYYLLSLGTLIKETICDAKHWLSGGKMSKSTNFPQLLTRCLPHPTPPPSEIRYFSLDSKWHLSYILLKRCCLRFCFHLVWTHPSM